MNNNTLCSCTGALHNCLAINWGARLPKHPNNNQMLCALHTWGDKMRVWEHILHCATCNVHLCVDCFTHFTLLRKSMTYNVSSSFPSQIYRLFREGMTMRWSYWDGIVAICHIDNVTGLATTSFTNEIIHHCDRTKPNEDLSFGLKIINNNGSMRDKKH